MMDDPAKTIIDLLEAGIESAFSGTLAPPLCDEVNEGIEDYESIGSVTRINLRDGRTFDVKVEEVH